MAIFSFIDRFFVFSLSVYLKIINVTGLKGFGMASISHEFQDFDKLYIVDEMVNSMGLHIIKITGFHHQFDI